MQTDQVKYGWVWELGSYGWTYHAALLAILLGLLFWQIWVNVKKEETGLAAAYIAILIIVGAITASPLWPFVAAIGIVVTAIAAFVLFCYGVAKGLGWLAKRRRL